MDMIDHKFKPGYYVVCILDLLGQQEVLKKWAKPPTDDHSKEEFLRGLEESAGRVLNVRNAFEGFFRNLNDHEMPESILNLLSNEQHATLDRAWETPLYIQHFSDTLVFYAPLQNIHGDTDMQPFLWMISSCVYALTGALAERIPIRGAITIGYGTELSPGNFYGPALAEAYYLESKMAKYPRVLVSDDALQLLNSNKAFSKDEYIEERNARLVILIRSLICVDENQCAMVDTMGTGAFSMDLNGALLRMFIPIAYSFVESELKRFSEANNAPLTERYKKLRLYMRDRLPVWGLSWTEMGYND